MLCWQVLGRESTYEVDDALYAIPIAPYAWPKRCGDYCAKALKNKEEADAANIGGKLKRKNQGFMAHDSQDYCSHECELRAAEEVRNLPGP
jgi:hypothetical protein